MKNQLRLIFPYSMIIFCILLGSCAKQNLPPMPDVGILEDKMNQAFQILAPEGWNSFKKEDSIVLLIRVIGEDDLIFQPDYGARIYYQADNQWIEVPNIMQYPDMIDVLSPSKGDVQKEGSVVVGPVFPDAPPTLMVRIVLVGSVYLDGQDTGKPEAAFIDLQLKQ